MTLSKGSLNPNHTTHHTPNCIHAIKSNLKMSIKGEGHIKIDRKILKWEWYQDANVFRLFMHLLLTANYQTGKWQGIEIGRGQVVTGLDKLREKTGLSVMQLRTAFDKLKRTGEITIKVTSKYRIVTICKYDDYQSVPSDGNKQNNSQSTSRITSEQQASNKQVTANKKNKKNKEEEEINTEAQAPKNEKFILFQEWIGKNAPNVSKLKEPFTVNQYESLAQDFPGKQKAIQEVLLAMHNKADLLKTYTSANLTLRNWMKRREEPDAVQMDDYTTRLKAAKAKHA